MHGLEVAAVGLPLAWMVAAATIVVVVARRWSARARQAQAPRPPGERSRTGLCRARRRGQLLQPRRSAGRPRLLARRRHGRAVAAAAR